MIEKKAFKKAFAAPFDKARCPKKGQSWYLDGKDALITINLQKCDWNEQYFVNIGIWLKALGEPSYPEEYKCHMDYRLENLFPERRELILTSCHLEMSSDELLSNLSIFLENQVLPFLGKLTLERSLREQMATGLLKKGIVLKKAKEYLTSDTPSL